MEKLTAFIKAHYIKIIFGVFFILMLGFLALPFLNYVFEFKEGETEIVKIIPVTFYQVMFGGKIATELTLKPDGFMIVSILFVIISVVCYAISWFSKKDTVRKSLNGVAFGLLILVILLLVGANKFLATYDYIAYTDGFDKISINPLGFSLTMICLSIMAIMTLASILSDLKFETREIAEIGMLVALSLVLDKLKLWVAGPSGGSVNLAGLPLLLIALRYGPLKTFIASSIVFGLISCLIDGYGFQTYPFDYLIAFSGYMATAFAFKGFGKIIEKKNLGKGAELGLMITALVIGCVSVMVTRMIGSSISSYIYFLDWLDPKWAQATGNNMVLAVMLYNISYIGPSACLSLIGAIILAKPMQMVNNRFPLVKRSVESSSEN